DGKAVSVFAVNKHFTEPRRVEIVLPGGQPMAVDGKARVTMLAHDDPFACNTMDDPARLSLRSGEVAPESDTLAIDVPPHAAACIQFNAGGGV
ncbi:MAG: hypothetical protein JW839_02575, partial [Candidatus Lokiarchaeota archaeon]|nr:hypothetical protein [Candidatus Lokiarchaeota archaeon]